MGGPDFAGAFGVFAHAAISVDYERKQRVSRLNDTVYFDDSFAGPIDPNYAAFIVRHNPRLQAWGTTFLSTYAVPRPDVVLHSRRRQEFEEIKPDNPFGVYAGQTKLAIIDYYMTRMGLPYVRGFTYTPTPDIPLLNTTVAGIPFKLSLAVKRSNPGLIVYEYCITTDWSKLAWGAAVAAVLAALAILFRAKIPLRDLRGLPIPVGPGLVPIG